MSTDSHAQARAARAAQDQQMLALIAAGRLRLPDNELLANAYRRQGDLRSAALEYARLHGLGCTLPAVAQFHAQFQGQNVPPRMPPGVFAPAPFVLLDGFFEPAANQALLAHAIARQADFHETEVYKAAQGRPPNRTSLVNYDVGPGGELMRAKVRAFLPTLCERLAMAPFEIAFIQLKIASYVHGDFFKVHHDNGENNPLRRISFVYYFHQEPKPYSGGELLLYDTRFDPSAYVRTLYSRIVPSNNSIIFFPSEYFHEVLPVQADGGDFAGSRFTLAGHIG